MIVIDARSISDSIPFHVATSEPDRPDLDRAFRDRWERGLGFDDVPVLTGDYAPTDALLTD
jgi:hypothetical protein